MSRADFEFESVLAEYENSFGSRPEGDQFDDAPKLNLTDIVGWLC